MTVLVTETPRTRERPLAASRLSVAFFWAQAGPFVLTAVGASVWGAGALQTDVDGVTDIGIITAMPPAALVAPPMVIAAFVWTLHRGGRTSLLGIHIAVLISMLFGLGAVVQPITGFKVVWRHAGIMEFISRTGDVDPFIDAYFNWPGFFSLGAFIVETTGIESALSIAEWSPVVFNLLYIGPLVILYRSFTVDDRLVWTSVLFFALGNWITQDYLAPQALGYLTHLMIGAIVVRWFRRTSETRGHSHAMARIALMAMVIGLFAATVASHQLTPFATAVAIGALVVTRQCTGRLLPLLMGTLVAAWVVFMASTYLAGHLEQLLDSVGQVSQSTDANFNDRLGGSPGHLFVVQARMATVGALVLLAAVGWVRSRRSGDSRWPLVLLGVAPLPLPILQPYGGEMLLRVVLFALPTLAFFAAAALLGARPFGRMRLSSTVPLFVVGSVLATAFLVTRYGNERLDHFTASDVRAVEILYDEAPSGALLLAGVENLPWKAQEYEAYRYRTVEGLLKHSQEARSVGEAVTWTIEHGPPEGSFFIVTRSQEAWVEIMGTLPAGALEEAEETVRSMPGTSLIHADGAARIYAVPGKEKP